MNDNFFIPRLEFGGVLKRFFWRGEGRARENSNGDRGTLCSRYMPSSITMLDSK